MYRKRKAGDLLVNNWREAYAKRIKPVFFIQVMGSALILSLLAMNFMVEFNLVQFKIVFWLLAVISFALALEDMQLKRQRSVYIFKFSTTLVYLVFPFLLFGT
ncbi:hypothetical protein AB685_09065 [Bacillus sp. LL01]|uniref:hypothetical protein n=1 Tax=Bacillus sp. LL01 TaxID=1665556 RepID=UPI00064D539A|nr:hypothetical protein [Bacillus sp. LL01]KMJ59196.1 hypothetical protein AB685_09065 [Bacillus sp. LL01]